MIATFTTWTLRRHAEPMPVPVADDGHVDRRGDVVVMDALTVIRGRRSVSVSMPPGPSRRELTSMLEIAVTAPDHGRCRPWRFIVLRGGNKDAFADVFAQAHTEHCQRTGLEPDHAQREWECRKLSRAPVMVVTACIVNKWDKIPICEQRAAVAAATQNLLVAATGFGYGSMWRTGSARFDPVIKAQLGLADRDTIEAFVYLGTVPMNHRPWPARNPSLNELVMGWSRRPAVAESGAA
jgi:nitroreductase